MHLKRLQLRHFRNYIQADISFSPGINWIHGENGQGKTNLLEAIHLLSTGRSFRTATLSDLIAFGKQFFYVEGHFEKERIQQEIKIYYDEKTRKVQYNETSYPTLTSLIGVLPSVFLSPDDLSLVSGSPSERRRFLDIYISQTDPLYLYHLGRYFRALKQRNALLKNRSEPTIDAWESTMAESASYLVTKRQTATDVLQNPALQWMDILSGKKEELKMEYHSSLSLGKETTDLSRSFQVLWKKHRPKEMHWGATQIGPHRDDLLLSLKTKEGSRQAKTFSSEGQKRSCISSLRFAQWEQMRALLGHAPLLGIDDFGIQLDERRRGQLIEHLPQFGQVFLTSPLPPNQENSAFAHLHVHAGHVNKSPATNLSHHTVSVQ